MIEDDLPEADRLLDAPHPRMTPRVYGQQAAEAEVLRAVNSGKMPHAWLLTGPEGIGKATFAWRMARFLLSEETGPSLFGDPTTMETLDTPNETPLAQRLRALSEPRLLLIRRAYDPERKRPKAQITVDEVRRLNAFFGLSVTDGGRRVVILDAADEMNPSAANALLKVLEEPPKGAVLLLVSHQPARLLPTIRSRCRTIRLSPLGPEELDAALRQAEVEVDDPDRLSRLARGSVGEAIRLTEGNGLALHARLLKLIDTSPGLDRAEASKIAEEAAARGAEARLDMTVRLIDLALSDLARAGAGIGDGSFDRLAPGPDAARLWASLQQELAAKIAHGRAVNIDPQALLLDAFFRIDETARRVT